MRKNNILKVLSAAAIASTLATVGYSTISTGENYVYAAENTSKTIELPATLRHFYEEKPSMGAAALVKVTVQKVDAGYTYSVYWKDLTFSGKTDGVSRFWVDGREVSLAPTTDIDGPNPKVAVFTLSELKDRLDVEVFVHTMENIMPGSGKQKARLMLDTTAAKMEFDKKEESTVNTETNSQNQNTPPTPPTNQPSANSSSNGNSNQGRPNQGGRPQFTPPAPGIPKTAHVEAIGTLENELVLPQGQAKFMNDSNLSSPSSYNAALESVTVKKVGNKFEYTLQVKKSEVTAPNGNKSQFELTKIFYNDFNKPLDFTIIDEKTATKTVKFTTDKLYSTLPLRAATEYSPGVEAQHNVALVLDFNNKLNTNTPTTPQAPKYAVFNGVTTKLMHAYEAGRVSMGDASLKHDKVLVFKDGDTYYYSVFFQDLTFSGQKDGITRFWINGRNVPILKTGGANNEVVVNFTSKEKLTTLPVSVFVQTMENIMPGSGTQSAILTFNWDNAKETSLEKKPSIPTGSAVTSSSNAGTVPIFSNGNGGGNHTPAINIYTPLNQPTVEGVEVTNFTGLKASLMHAHQPGRPSMGNAALNRVEAFEQNGVYHYLIYFTDISVGSLKDGITRFWVNGSEVSVVKTGGANNEVRVHFTNSQKLTQIPVSVFVQTMENIMPGGGKQDAILTFDWSNVVESKGPAPINLDNGALATPGSSTSLTPVGGRYNNGRLASTGLETSSSIYAGIATLFVAIFLARKKQK